MAWRYPLGRLIRHKFPPQEQPVEADPAAERLVQPADLPDKPERFADESLNVLLVDEPRWWSCQDSTCPKPHHLEGHPHVTPPAGFPKGHGGNPWSEADVEHHRFGDIIDTELPGVCPARSSEGERCSYPTGHPRLQDEDGEAWDHAYLPEGDSEGLWWNGRRGMPEYPDTTPIGAGILASTLDDLHGTESTTPAGLDVFARTPHGSYTFAVTGLDLDPELGVVLRLQEVSRLIQVDEWSTGPTPG